MSKPYGIFLDIDGTILWHNQINHRDREAIQWVREAGHQVFINTGRSYAHLPVEIFELEVNGIVAGLGSDIRVEGRQVYSQQLPFPLLDRAAELLEDLCFLFEGEDAIYQHGDRFQDPHPRIKSGIPFSQQYPEAKISKFCLCGKPSSTTIAELKKELIYFEFSTYSELGMIGRNKATGMKWVLDYLNIPLERCIAIGDSANDLDMLEAAGISVAMGNAPDEIKQRCQMVTTSVTEGGVAQALEKLLR